MNHKVELYVAVDVIVNNRNAIDRVVNNEADVNGRGEEVAWRDMYYPLYTEQDVLNHLAAVCVSAGVEDASRLDGWGDLERGEVTMMITDVEPE